MSSILKALKKLEREKTGRFPESLNIDADILRTTESTRSFSPLTLFLFSLLIFAVGGAVTFLLMNNYASIQPETTSQAVAGAANVQKQDFPPRIKTETLPAEIVVAPAVRKPAKSRQVPQHKTTVADNFVKPKEADSSAERKNSAASRTVPILRVNGIAFQKNSTDSMAIVNGIPVSRGATIEGVTVDDILKDRVVFRYDGEQFEINLGQSK